MAPTLVEHVVADAGAFLKKAPLQEFGRNVYTLREVLEEIRDRPTRRSLAFLPYQLTFREPHPEHVRTVTEFSKKTGDYPSLSATDIKVLALTYQLQLEHGGPAHIRTEPQLQVNVQSTQRHPEAPLNIAGFHLPSRRSADVPNSGRTETSDRSSEPSDRSERFNSFQFWREPLPSIQDELLDLLGPGGPEQGGEQRGAEPNEHFNSFQFWRDPLPNIDEDLLAVLTDEGAEPRQAEDQSDDEDKENALEEKDDDDDDDDDGGWITPGNIQQLKMESSDWTEASDVRVGCLTTDFAMQNVLIQMGLHVLSLGGLLIRQARSHILRCHACFRTTSDMSKAFCPHCGNPTLKKLAVTLSQDGRLQMHFSRNPKVLNPRGARHSLPLPRGGKHTSNPHLVEDQRFPQQRPSRKARQKTDALDPDYAAAPSPFCDNDIHSRAASLQIRDARSGAGRRRANPNAARAKFVRRT